MALLAATLIGLAAGPPAQAAPGASSDSVVIVHEKAPAPARKEVQGTAPRSTAPAATAVPPAATSATAKSGASGAATAKASAKATAAPAASAGSKTTAAPAAAKPAAKPTGAAPAPEKQATGAGSDVAPAPATPGRSGTSRTQRPPTQLASTRPVATGAATRPARVATTPAPQEERVTYHYNALGRRDPFQPLVGGGFVGLDEGGSAPPDVGGMTVVGIVWGAEDKFALVEDGRGNSMVLRQGDKVTNGYVESLKRDAVVVKLSVDGQTHVVSIPLTRKGEKNESR